MAFTRSGVRSQLHQIPQPTSVRQKQSAAAIPVRIQNWVRTRTLTCLFIALTRRLRQGGVSAAALRQAPSEYAGEASAWPTKASLARHGFRVRCTVKLGSSRINQIFKRLNA